MRTLIKYYDKDVLKNIIATLTLRPDRVVLFYDSQLTDPSAFYGLKRCFRRNIPDIQLETHPVDILDIEDIYQKTVETIRQNGQCMIELTGGSELMMIGGYRAGLMQKAHLYYTDLIQGEILDLQTSKRIKKTVRLTLEDFVDAGGACFIGSSRQEPQEKRFSDILAMCRILFENLESWRQTSGFFQTVAARYGTHDLQIQSKIAITQKHGKAVCADKYLLQMFQKFNFIHSLRMTQEHVSLSFASQEDKSYLISFGVWLELYVYICAVQTGAFDDVKLGTMIDWNAYDGVKVAGNEIDLILMDHSLPVFISCKLRNADTAALNELVVAKKRVGGWFSKGIVVAFGRDKKETSGTYKRAQELGISLLDAKDILSANFGERLVKTIRENDLVSLKWRRV